MYLDCYSYKASSVPGSGSKGLRHKAALIGVLPIFCLVWGFSNIPFKTINVLWKILDFRKSLWLCHRLMPLYTPWLTCSWLKVIQHKWKQRQLTNPRPQKQNTEAKIFLDISCCKWSISSYQRQWNFWDASLFPTDITLLKCFRYM